jgi:hypothetical protein
MFNLILLLFEPRRIKNVAFQEMGHEELNWTKMSPDNIKWRDFVNTVTNLQQRNFLID